MARSRNKMSRKELVETDQITSRLEQSAMWVIDHPRPFIWGIAGVVGTIAVVAGWSLYASGRHEQAQLALGAVIRTFHNAAGFESEEARYQATLEEAVRVEEAFGGRAGQIARYYAALSHEALGDTGETVRILEELAGSGHPTIRPPARFALGQTYTKEEQFDRAIEVYRTLLDSGEYASPPILFELAGLSEAAGRAAEALDFYESLMRDYPDSVYQPEAERAVKRLGAGGAGSA
jgi:tetratricopeptide (TPR) repeat protein